MRIYDHDHIFPFTHQHGTAPILGLDGDQCAPCEMCPKICQMRAPGCLIDCHVGAEGHHERDMVRYREKKYPCVEDSYQLTHYCRVCMEAASVVEVPQEVVLLAQ